MSLAYQKMFPVDKISLDSIPLSCIVLGFLQYYFLYIFLDRWRKFYDYLSTSHSLNPSELSKSERVQVDQKIQDKYNKCSELSNIDHSPCLGATINVNDKNLYKDDVEMVTGRLGIVWHHESGHENVEEIFGFNEFSAIFEEEEPSLEEVKAAFDVFDVNRDGFIDAAELRRVVCVLGFKDGVEMEDCRKMIKAFDINGDGRIDFNEFLKFMENSFC